MRRDGLARRCARRPRTTIGRREPTRRSISAPTIAGCWSRVRPRTDSASSTRSRGSFVWARGLPLRAASARRRSSARSRRCWSAATRCARAASRRARLIATEACRAAENGEEFRARVAEEAGLELEIVDSATEARLAAAGCTELFDPAASGVILFDIGGGSSELVRLGRPNGAAADRRSRKSSAGPRCRSASSRSPSVTAAPSCRARSTTPWSKRSPASSPNSPTSTAATSTASTCSARRAR